MAEFEILTIYPEIFSSFLSEGIIQRARNEGKISITVTDFRQFGLGKHRKVDAAPFGGGAGMVIRPEPVVDALNASRLRSPHQETHKILVSPQGSVFNQKKAQQLSRLAIPIVLVCGRFEGFDQRIKKYVDEEVSLGDFVLLGGEIAAMAMIEAVSRLIPGVIGNQESLECESFSNHLLEYSQYTKPVDFQGDTVPPVLRSGDHQKIRDWRTNDAIEKTRERRQDLYQQYLKEQKPEDLQ